MDLSSSKLYPIAFIDIIQFRCANKHSSESAWLIPEPRNGQNWWNGANVFVRPDVNSERVKIKNVHT